MDHRNKRKTNSNSKLPTTKSVTKLMYHYSNHLSWLRRTKYKPAQLQINAESSKRGTPTATNKAI